MRQLEEDCKGIGFPWGNHHRGMSNPNPRFLSGVKRVNGLCLPDERLQLRALLHRGAAQMYPQGEAIARQYPLPRSRKIGHPLHDYNNGTLTH
ncbi:hypothetical protein [uncultured Microbulbifer sp.]|uniref:hypothetical protein n=1 Tax=uncultured Microbulbifer sp. TaxID=348147 RepID=UPI00262EE0E6|nr:hypothetical protein [uncultured Microbulbifer sp.]